MLRRYRGLHEAGLLVWFFALGYFVSYIPYSALAKAMTQGYLTIGERPIAGFDILPATLLGTIMTMPLLVARLGGFRFTRVRLIGGRTVPVPHLDTLLSGLGFAAIISATTMAYSFSGISIVLALVMMRAGVLTIAPMVDAISGRQVHPYSWLAFALSLGAVVVAFSQVGNYTLTIGAIANLALYLCGYFARLSMMSRHAKVVDEAVNRRFVAEECVVAMIALAAIGTAIAVVRGCGEGLTAGCAFMPFLANPLLVPALVTGIAYGFLGVFATLIYLNELENTFAIPVFCCASLLSGVAASLSLTWLFGAPPLKVADLISAGMIMLAGLLLYVRSAPRSAQQVGGAVGAGPRRLLLFVCSGNTSRSPIAQAICNAEIIRRLVRAEGANQVEMEVASAGLTAKPGAPITPEARQALARLSVPVPEHASRNLTPELIEAAAAIICMTSEQCKAVLAISTAASGKVHRLHPFRDLDDPTGQGAKAYLKLSRQIQHLIAHRLSYFMLATTGRT
jgi:protein-tyrosine-phosphatase